MMPPSRMPASTSRPDARIAEAAFEQPDPADQQLGHATPHERLEREIEDRRESGEQQRVRDAPRNIGDLLAERGDVMPPGDPGERCARRTGTSRAVALRGDRRVRAQVAARNQKPATSRKISAVAERGVADAP